MSNVAAKPPTTDEAPASPGSSTAMTATADLFDQLQGDRDQSNKQQNDDDDGQSQAKPRRGGDDNMFETTADYWAAARAA